LLFVCFLLVIVSSVLRRITASDYPIWYLQTSLSLSLLLDYLYTKASMCLLTRYYSVVVVELSPSMLYASFVVFKCDPHYRKMFEKTYWKILHILLLEPTNLIRLLQIMSIPTMFRLFHVMTSEMLGRLLPIFTLLL